VSVSCGFFFQVLACLSRYLPDGRVEFSAYTRHKSWNARSALETSDCVLQADFAQAVTLDKPALKLGPSVLSEQTHPLLSHGPLMEMIF